MYKVSSGKFMFLSFFYLLISFFIFLFVSIVSIGGASIGWPVVVFILSSVGALIVTAILSIKTLANRKLGENFVLIDSVLFKSHFWSLIFYLIAAFISGWANLILFGWDVFFSLSFVSGLVWVVLGIYLLVRTLLFEDK